MATRWVSSTGTREIIKVYDQSAEVTVCIIQVGVGKVHAQFQDFVVFPIGVPIAYWELLPSLTQVTYVGPARIHLLRVHQVVYCTADARPELSAR